VDRITFKRRLGSMNLLIRYYIDCTEINLLPSVFTNASASSFVLKILKK
jgi:hypothetical protein